MSVGAKKGIGKAMGGVSVVKIFSSSVISSVGGESENVVFSFGKPRRLWCLFAPSSLVRMGK